MSYCLLNSKNFAHNIKEISQYISVEKIAFVLKNNAYGHGLLEMAKLAKKNKNPNICSKLCFDGLWNWCNIWMSGT